MSRLLRVVLVLGLVGTACGGGGEENAQVDSCQGMAVMKSGTFDLARREGAIVHVPDGYDPAVATPVVLSLHGAQDQPAGSESQTGFSELADREGFLVVYPIGREEALPPGSRNVYEDSGYRSAPGWSMARTRVGQNLSSDQQKLPSWITAGLVQGNPDVAYIEALLDELPTLFCVDSRRIYATGHSMGGGFAFTLGCTLADRFAAIGVASAWQVKDMGDCVPARPVPIMGFFSIDDSTNPYEGGSSFGAPVWSFAEFGELWGELNDCEPGPEPRDRSGDATSEVWPGCAAPVVMWSLSNGGHTWPGSPTDDTASTDIDASEMLWEFFAEKQLA